MRSPKWSGCSRPSSSCWPGDSIWNIPIVRVGADQLRRSAGSPSGMSSTSNSCPGCGAQVDRVAHRRQHPHREHVELEQPQRRDVVLVELAHRVAGSRALQRGAVAQGGVGQQDPARVQGEVAGEAVDALDDVEQPLELARVEPCTRSSGSVRSTAPGRPAPGRGLKVLGDVVDLVGRQAEHLADLADRPSSPGRSRPSPRRRCGPRRTVPAPCRRRRGGGATRRRRRCRAARRGRGS
jgi:hypothetical protein